MTDNSRAIVPVGQHGVVASVSRQIAVTEKLLGRILDSDGKTVLPVNTELIENLIYTDPQTGLMWARNGNIARKVMNWNKAMEWVKNLNYGGYNDWHLPSKEEFEVFVKQGGNSPSEWFNVNGFNKVRAYFYWSSSTCEYNADEAYDVYMPEGYMNCNEKLCDFYVWPVRGEQSSQNLLDEESVRVNRSKLHQQQNDTEVFEVKNADNTDKHSVKIVRGTNFGNEPGDIGNPHW